MNFKKKMSVAVTAAVCCSMISTFNAAVSAEEYTAYEGASIVSELSASDPAYTEAVKLAGLKFNSGLAKKVKSYEEKTPKNSVKFGKSRTKSYFNKLTKKIQNMNADEISFSVSMVSKDEVASIAMKGEKAKLIAYSNIDDMSFGYGIYMDTKNITTVFLDTKEKMTSPLTDDYFTGDTDITSSVESVADFNIADSTKGKLFKFKYNNKGYYYEVFETEDGESFGYVFDTKLNLVMMMDDTGYYSVKITTSVKNSDVTVPDYYTEMELDY